MQGHSTIQRAVNGPRSPLGPPTFGRSPSGQSVWGASAGSEDSTPRRAGSFNDCSIFPTARRWLDQAEVAHRMRSSSKENYVFCAHDRRGGSRSLTLALTRFCRFTRHDDSALERAHLGGPALAHICPQPRARAVSPEPAASGARADAVSIWIAQLSGRKSTSWTITRRKGNRSRCICNGCAIEDGAKPG